MFVMRDKSSSSKSKIPKTDISIYQLKHKQDNMYDFELVYVYKVGAGQIEVIKGTPKRKSVFENVKVSNIVDAGIEKDIYTDKQGTFIIPKNNTTFEGNIYYKALRELKK